MHPIIAPASRRRIVVPILACLALLPWAAADAQDLSGTQEPLNAATIAHLKDLYKRLIDAENRHDLVAVAPMLWNSPSMLFVAKTATPSEGNWAGFWGTQVVLLHFGDLYRGVFKMEPDYAKERVVGLSKTVAQTYVPLQISVAYAGQEPVPKPFLMIVEWVRTASGWKMATDIALPVPPTP